MQRVRVPALERKCLFVKATRLFQPSGLVMRQALAHETVGGCSHICMSISMSAKEGRERTGHFVAYLQHRSRKTGGFPAISLRLAQRFWHHSTNPSLQGGIAPAQ